MAVFNFYEELEKYFATTPHEKVMEDWEKSKKFDEVGPSVDEFLLEAEIEAMALKLYPPKVVQLGDETSYDANAINRMNWYKGFYHCLKLIKEGKL